MEDNRVDAERFGKLEATMQFIVNMVTEMNTKLDNNVVTRREFDQYKADQEKNSLSKWLPHIFSAVSIGIAAVALIKGGK